MMFVQEVVMLLLQHDACASVINGNAEIPKDVTKSSEIKSMLEGKQAVWQITNCSCEMVRGGRSNKKLKCLTFCPWGCSVSKEFKGSNHATIFQAAVSVLSVLLKWMLTFYFLAAERTEERKLEEQLLEAAREGTLATLTRLVTL